MSKKITIRPARISDCGPCFALAKIPELRVPDGRDLPLWYFKEFIKKRQPFFVAEHNKTVIGFMIAEKIIGNGWLAQYLTVRKELRRQKVGSMLLDYFLKQAKQKRVLFILGYAVQTSPIGVMLKKRGAYFGEKVQEFGIDLGWSKRSSHLKG